MPAGSEGELPAIFATTRWTMVLRARDAGRPGAERVLGGGVASDSEAARTALEQLCRVYWRPLLSFAVRSGFSREDAEDFTQEFFLRLLSRDALARVSPEKGRFRNFLLVGFRNYLADQRDKARAAKRGGGIALIPLDSAGGTAEDRDGGWPEPGDGATPEHAFDRQWAYTVLHRARARLREESIAAGRLAVYEALGPEESESDANRAAGDGPDGNYVALGQRLGLTVPAIKSAAFRLRQRYRELIRSEVAETVGTLSELEDELRHLLRVLES